MWFGRGSNSNEEAVGITSEQTNGPLHQLVRCDHWPPLDAWRLDLVTLLQGFAQGSHVFTSDDARTAESRALELPASRRWCHRRAQVKVHWVESSGSGGVQLFKVRDRA